MHFQVIKETNETSPNAQQRNYEQYPQQQVRYSPPTSQNQVRYSSPAHHDQQQISVPPSPAGYTTVEQMPNHYSQSTQSTSTPPALLAISTVQHHPNIVQRFPPVSTIGRHSNNGQQRFDSPGMDQTSDTSQQRYASTPLPNSHEQLLPPQEDQLQNYQHHSHQNITPPPPPTEIEYIHAQHHQIPSYEDPGNPALHVKNEEHEETDPPSVKLAHLQTIKSNENRSNNNSISPVDASSLGQQITHQAEATGTTYTTLETVSSANNYHAAYNPVSSPYPLQQTPSISSPGYSGYLYQSSSGGLSNKSVAFGTNESPLIYTKSDPTLTSTSINANSKSSTSQLYSSIQSQPLTYDPHQQPGSPNSHITVYGHGNSANCMTRLSLSTDSSGQYWAASESPTHIDYVASGYGGALQNSMLNDGVSTSSSMQQAYAFGNNGGAVPSTSWGMPFDDSYETSKLSFISYTI